MVGFRGFFLITLACFLAACGGAASEPADLKQAAAAIKAMSAPRHLARSMYVAAFPGDTTPSRYVSYLFSQMGAAEWPMAVDEMEREAMAAARIPVLPDGVRVVPQRTDPTAGRQLVIGFDDARGVVTARGYEAPGGEPVLEWEWSLKAVRPAPGVVEIYRSNAQMGMSNQAF